MMGEVMSNDDKTTPDMASVSDVAADSTDPEIKSEAPQETTEGALNDSDTAHKYSSNNDEEIPNAEVVAASDEEQYHAQQILMGKKPSSSSSESSSVENLDYSHAISPHNASLEPVKPEKSYEQLDRKYGEILKYYRQKQGISLQNMARVLQVSPGTVVSIESSGFKVAENHDYISTLLTKYAAILGIDDKFIVELYEQQIAESIQITRKNSTKKPVDRIMNRSWLVAVLVVVVAAGGYFIFKEEDKSNQGTNIEISAGDVANNGPTTDSAQNPNSTALVSTINQGAKDLNNQMAQNQVVVEDKRNADASKVKPVDENTARATAQSNALQQSATKHAIEQAQNASTSPNALPLQKESGITFATGDAPDRQKNTLIDANSVTAQANAKDSVATAATAVTAKATAPAKETTQIAPNTQAAAGAAQSTALASNDKNNNAAQNTQTAAAKNETADAKKEEATKVEAPTLKAKLDDISSKVTVKNREGLASLNSAKIAVNGDVAVKVIDGSKRVLANGVYKKGDHINITGIPPLKVQVSDTEAVSISYMGGTVTVPKDKQVQFALPMR